MIGNNYDVIVIGGGHAGTEAAWAAAGALSSPLPPGEGKRVALITMDPSKIGAMSCNPAIGGLAKGQIVREIDALGGMMGRAADATGIQFRMLNMSKGPAVRGPRAQCDKYAYAAEVQRLLSTRDEIDVIAGTVDEIIVEDGRVVGVVVNGREESAKARGGKKQRGEDASVLRHTLASSPLFFPAAASSPHHRLILRAGAVVLTTGTFMRGLMHTGEKKSEGGRVGEGSAVGISGMLRRLGFELGRLKTGTPPRLAAESINFDALEPQVGDDEPTPFSDVSPHALPGGRFPWLEQVVCHSTQTSPEAHELIRANLHRAPMYCGQIEADCGPRYCPSIEDKVVRFAERDSHHVFLEPESLHTNEIYCNGISTSLPVDVQERIVHTMPGCEKAEILRWGYAVEYDMVWPHQIDATCMTRRVEGLFFAGQINCTTGYEEAGAQGLVAGLNAARFARGLDPVVLRRDQSYIGVLMDDLVTKTPREPYRMFTSRAEYRLLLRADNSDLRLTPLGREWGLVDDERWRQFEARRSQMDALASALRATRINGKTAADYCRRPEATARDVAAMLGGRRASWVGRASSPPSPPRIDLHLLDRVMIDIQYEGYIDRQRAEIKRQEKAENTSIPADLDFRSIEGLRPETKDVLSKFRPTTMGRAGRLAGVNPADLTILAVAIRKHYDRAGMN